MLGIHFSNNKKVQMQNNFITTIKKIQQVLRLWNSRMLTLEGRNMILKNLAISKIVYLALKTNLPKVIVKELEKIQNKFYGKTHVLKQNIKVCLIFLKTAV